MNPTIDIRVGDALTVLRQRPARSVDCVVTSPPYWGLRDYGTDGQMGLEGTPGEYVAGLVEIFREVWRVLADHGTVWLNLGDSYVSSDQAQVRDGKAVHDNVLRPPTVEGLRAKNLIGIPWRVAFALQADGWYLRSDIIWSKRNPMPESVTDRPTKAHEYLFLLTKQPRYYYDHAAIREPAEWARWGDQTNGKHEGTGTAATWIGAKTKEELQARATPTWDERKAAGAMRGNVAFDGKVGAGTQRAVHGEGLSHDLGDPALGRNKRSVWEIATEPYAEAHFATFPTALVEPCVKAGCPECVCRACGKPRERIVERTSSFATADRDGHPSRYGDTETRSAKGFGMPSITTTTETAGWSDCGHDNWRTGVVLDPFMGSGTSLLVARRLGRSSIGIELNPEYADLARRRLATWWRDPSRGRDEQIEGQLAMELAAPE